LVVRGEKARRKKRVKLSGLGLIEMAVNESI
jgi:hypothetical protein